MKIKYFRGLRINFKINDSPLKNQADGHPTCNIQH